MKDNGMEVNPSKCGIMEINSPILLLNEPILFNGEEIPKVEKYIYLGIEFNNMLDINLMSKFRIDKGKMVLNTLIPTLRNNTIPLEYRLMLIKGILIPTLNYGCEIFGMNEQRMGSLKRILDNGLKCINRKSNFCRLRTYDEFDIKPLYISAAVGRVRGIKKWEGSYGLISDCIKSQKVFKSKESTWIKETKRWLKVMKLDIDLPIKELLSEVKKNRNTRLHERDKSNIGAWADKLNIKSGKLIRKYEINKAINYKGINMITKIRTGTFTFTNQLVRLSYLPLEFKNKCVGCNQVVIEDVEHLILNCNLYNAEREAYFPNLSAKLQIDSTDNTKMNLLKKLLGEEGLTSGRKIGNKVRRAIKYLAAILPKRAAAITERKGDNV